MHAFGPDSRMTAPSPYNKPAGDARRARIAFLGALLAAWAAAAKPAVAAESKPGGAAKPPQVQGASKQDPEQAKLDADFKAERAELRRRHQAERAEALAGHKGATPQEKRKSLAPLKERQAREWERLFEAQRPRYGELVRRRDGRERAELEKQREQARAARQAKPDQRAVRP